MKRFAFLGVMLVVVALVASGCQSYGQAGGLGAALGAGAGAIIGHQSGHAGEGAAIGALVGGMSGLIAHDIKARKAKDRAATMEEYNYQPTDGEMLTLEDANVFPAEVRPGDSIGTMIQYALLGTSGGSAQVQESRKLMMGNQLVAEMSSKTFGRADGTWVSEQQFKLAKNLKPGSYQLVQVIQTPNSRISSSSPLTVK